MLTTDFLFLYSFLTYTPWLHWWTEILGLRQHKTHVTTEIKVAAQP